MKRYFFIIYSLLFIFPTLASAEPHQGSGAIVSLDFQSIPQGHVGIVHVTGEDISEVRAVFQERVYYFYQDSPTSFTGLLSADMESETQPYPMQVWVKYVDGTAEKIDQNVEVSSGGYGSYELAVPASMMPLLEPEINTAETEKLFNIMTRFTPERYWAGGFTVPNTNEFIAWFGTWRLYNGTYWYRHTGVDIKVGVGNTIAATAGGRVMLSEMMPIRGNYVLIDHGWGVYSGYAHMSERFVVPGQWVQQGDIIGLSGMTGRTSGAHIHWEMAVGGVWIDPETFMALGLDTNKE